MATPPIQEPPIQDGVPSEERTWGMLCHLTAFVTLIGIPFGNVIAPLVVWLIKRDTMPFVDDQGKESLNFNISVTLYALVSGIAVLVIIGFFLLLAVVLFWLVMTIVAAIKSSNGEYYRYPLCIRFIK